ncbi:MAG: ATPase [Chthoniobacterales bacterium]|nr:ATPase [Chthoniobacterales bacterium]
MPESGSCWPRTANAIPGIKPETHRVQDRAYAPSRPKLSTLSPGRPVGRDPHSDKGFTGFSFVRILAGERRLLDIKENIRSGGGVLGIELGSTRIKAVFIGPDHMPVASGGHEWENTLKDGFWTYSLEEIWAGIRSSFSALQADVEAKHGVRIERVRAMGVSGMMHGYMVFDAGGNQLVPFRTWRNNLQAEASEKLAQVFDYPIPQRWSIAHLYQAILNGEDHVRKIAHMTTLAGYVHWKLTGQRVLGIGEASGMFPMDIGKGDFHAALMSRFDDLVRDAEPGWQLEEILPRILTAGERAGELTGEGAGLLDPTGCLKAGIPLCPPEGDAGTGMVATNSVEVSTGNVSAGTSVFAMLVLNKELSRVYHVIDLVTTPDGKLVGMVHSNNCTSDSNAWIQLFGQAAEAFGLKLSAPVLYDTLLELALQGDPDCGGLLSYGYISGEHITGFSEGRPLFVRSSQSRFTLANFMRAHLFSALCALRTGLNILMREEGIRVDELRGHGGFFKTPEVGRRIMAAATGIPVAILETSGEGGAWGIALLASYMVRENAGTSLPGFLKPIFAKSLGAALAPDPADAAGFERFFERYHKGLAVERAAVASLP